VPAIANFEVRGADGYPILADPYGNNVAFRCIGCGGPVLAIIREHQRGSSPENPSECRACRAKYWVEALIEVSQLVVHRVSP
jgi:uncharacterized protein with PIN domain